MINKKYLSFCANQCGYHLLYKGVNIGGAGILRYKKIDQRIMLKDFKMYVSNAKQDIQDIVNGRGQENYLKQIKLIDRGKK